MPQASKELSDKMLEYFGDPISDTGPTHYLLKQGYTLTRRWTWVNPRLKSLEDITEKERDCIIFMMEEGDYDGVEILN